MDPNEILALQSFNSGAAEQTPSNPNTHHPTNNSASQGSTNNLSIPDVFTNATPSTRPADWGKPKHNIPCTWEGCSQMFTCRHNVEQHIREKHTGERPYVCAICAQHGGDSTFARPASLYRHMRQQHRIEPDVPNKWRPRKTVKTAGPVSAVPVSAAQPKKRGRKPNAVDQQATPAPAPEPASTAMPMQPPAADIQSYEYCGAELTGAEHALLHMHLEHGIPASPNCGCSFCKNQRIQQAPLQQPVPFHTLPPAPQQPAPFSLPIQQPQPRRPVSISQLEQRLLAVQQEQCYTESTTGSADFTPPFDPAPTPGPDGSEQQFPDIDPAQNGFGFIDYSQFADGFGELPDGLDDLFPELGDISKFGGDFNF